MTIYLKLLSMCENGCGNKAIRFTLKGKAVCSHRPAQCPMVLKRMQNTSLIRYGVPNCSSTNQVKEIRKQKSINKYGVDNVSKSNEVRTKLSKQRVEYWNTIYQNKKFTIDGLTKQQYRHRCQQYANTQYQRNKVFIDPENKRNKKWHIDHIFSILNGFLNDVPINIISDISNLRLISATENYRKYKKSEKTLTELYEDFHR